MESSSAGNKKMHLHTHGSSRARTTGARLDHNVLCIIFSFLDLFDLAHCSVVCKSWHVVINRSKLLQVFYLKQQQLDGSTSLEKPLNVYLEELAMERHRLALARGSVVVNQWRGHSVGVNRCRMKRGLLITGGGDKVMRLWSLENYKCLEEYSTPDSTSLVDFDFDESKIVGLLGTRICIWRRDGARSVFPPRDGTFSKGLCMRYLDPEAVVGCEDGTARVFDMYSRKCSRILRMHSGPVTCLCMSDDQLILSGSSLGSVSISSLSSDQQVSKLRTRDSTDIRALCFNPCSHLVFAGSTSGNMSCWDVRTMRILWEKRASPNVLYSLQHLRNDSSTLVVGGIDGILRVLNQNTGEIVSRIALAGNISSSRDKDGVVARTRGARLAEDVHIDSIPKIIRPPIFCLAVGMKKVVTTHNTKFIRLWKFS
ncbi:F-box/WD-40 repeat-containing protein At3g52030 [Humulus lupulus]|uniref:F-box/WD-40 repeat-containing protein At3g52030 n=1 Tax=Humulus lupulus TaxID=3486 RepID=UPI002B4137BF|nr:F-box/WD-40 repeat-containing protein At3g52030 [Humulus lupulus]